MKKFLFILLALVLLLSACAPMQEDALPTESGTSTTESTTEPTTPTHTEPTVPTVTEPLHSELYLPQYDQAQMLTFFNEVVLDMEYTHGPGDASLVQKWVTPIYYTIYGDPTQEDQRVLEDLFAQLNAMPGFSGIYPAQSIDEQNLSLGFYNQQEFQNLFSDVIGGEDAYGATQFWYYTATNEIHTARIGYRTDIDQVTRNSILIEEIVNTLGISDTVLRQDSIVYQYSNDNLALSDVDWVILKILYDPAIQCGMDRTQCAEILHRLYY